MICAVITETQKVEQYMDVTFQSSQTISCNAQLQNSKVKLFFPGVYAIQWSITGRTVFAGTVMFQVFAGGVAIPSCEASAQVDANKLITLTSAPVMMVHLNQTAPLALSLHNCGGSIILSNAVLTVRKVY